MNKLYPAYLFIGAEKEINEYIDTFLKSILCKNNKCNTCLDCKNIERKQHALIRFLQPEGQYTISQLDIIFKTIIFKLNIDQDFFFIINKADLLNVYCANSLLKSLEEPPQGYHFILISSTKDNILPTIASRCIIKEFRNYNSENNILLESFINLNINNNDIMKKIESTKISEHEIPLLIDQLYQYWSDILKKSETEKITQKLIIANKALNILDHSKEYYPMPGSAKIFIRNLMLQFLSILN